MGQLENEEGIPVTFARHRAELSTVEAAKAVGVPVDVIKAAEADKPISTGDSAAAKALVASLSTR